MTKKIPENLLGKPFIFWEFTAKDNFNLEELYKRVREIMIERDWMDMHTNGDDYETFFLEQELPGGATNHDIWWRAHNKPHHNAGDTIHFYLKLSYKTLVMKKKDIVEQGRKVTIDSGELRVICEFYLDDHHRHGEDVWKKHPVLKLFKPTKFWYRLRRPAVKAAEDELIEFSNLLYSFLGQNTTVESVRGTRDFLPPRGATF